MHMYMPLCSCFFYNKVANSLDMVDLTPYQILHHTMDKETALLPTLHGTSHLKRVIRVLPGRSKILVLMLMTGSCVFALSHYYQVHISFSSFVQNHASDKTATTSGEVACNFSNGSWMRDFRGPMYTNRTCPTMPESKNCEKYGKPMDFVNWRWKPHECQIPRFEPQSFLNIVRGKTLAFAGDSLARNQMESLLCLLSQAEVPINVHRDATDKFATWRFRSHNFTLMVLWTKFLVEQSERTINGTVVEVHDIHLDKLDTRLAANLHQINILVISSGHWFFRTNYLYESGELIGCISCPEANITKFSVLSAIQKVFRTALQNLTSCQECNLQLTLVRTRSSVHFENGPWNGGGYCNRTQPVSEEEAMSNAFDWEVRKIQMEEAKREHRKPKVGGMNIAILDVTKAMIMRPDAHPGIHWNNQWMRGYSDCSHWCLPGPIDMWNELLLAVLDKYRKHFVDQ